MEEHLSPDTNVLLINPRVGESSQNKRINALINITFPTSLGVLAGYLMGSGIHEVNIIDEQIDPLDGDSLSASITTMRKPRIIGLSVLTLNCGRAYELAGMIKAVDPEVLIVFGGIHPTVMPEEVLGNNNVDVVVRGEGEETFKELVHLVIAGKDFSTIPGISCRTDAAIQHNADRPLLEDLDVIPPFPYYLFERNLPKYPNFSGVFGSRGCPYSCTFCSSRSISGRKYRYHSIQRVISECTTLIRKYKQKSVFLMDDNISVNKRHFMGLCDAIIQAGLHKEAYFFGSMRGDNATDEILDYALRANFRIIGYGLETCSEKLMKVINKGETVEEVISAIKRTAEKGMHAYTTIIFGLPTETREDRWAAIRKVRSLPLSSVRFNTLVPYPGTPAYNMLASEGKLLIKKNWENFGVQYMWESDDIPYVPDSNDRLELIFDTMFANLSYYLSVKGLKLLLTQSLAGGAVIKLSDKWYLSVRETLKMASAFLYLGYRFVNVTVRMLCNTIKKRLWGKT
ncbi:MAG: hypothetical protein C0402_06710 [Thermodesulfovibrio sp.]|nr:hypothetical protein [Thermodesulfovibrio sp.]